MKLQLFNWPPIASHGLCLGLGYCLANLTAAPIEPHLRLPKDSVSVDLGAIDIPERTVGTSSLANNGPLSPMSLTLKHADGSLDCKLSPFPLYRMAERPRLILSAKRKDGFQLLRILSDIEEREMALVPFEKTLAHCDAKPKVVYGTP